LQAPAAAPDLRQGLRKTRGALIGRLEQLLRGRTALDADLFDQVEKLLFGADIGVQTADDLLEAARGASSASEIGPRLEARALEILAGVAPAEIPETGSPHVVMVVGVNGSGKTTSIAKLAARWIGEGRKVLLAAADTYRAAAVQQLGEWAERVGADIVEGEPGGDPASVAFDALRAARARGADVVIIDTAGRLQTQAGLMDELAKVARVVGKAQPGAPHETLLVLDANTGQNAIRQAQEFGRAIGVTSLILAKLDGTAKGGVVLGIAAEVGLPVRWVGLGEGCADLVEFDPEAFVRELFRPTAA
jgi:fused signal recognition particle receptor